METNVLDDLIVGRVEPHIYAFTTNTIPNCLKVGDTYRPVEVRLAEWREHYPSLVPEFDDVATVSSDVFFRDFSVHEYLENDGHFSRMTAESFKPGVYFSREFFKGACKGDVADAISDIREDFEKSGQKYRFYKVADKLPTDQKYPSTGRWELRPNQRETVKKFAAALAKKRWNLLMYAVMRFGKSFTSMCCAATMNGGKGAKLVVVLSAKADVCDEWRRTVESADNFRDDYEFFSSKHLRQNPKVVTDHLHKKHKKAVVFLTLQDLQNEEIKRKHRYLFKEKIDLLIVDETHYGARADSYGKILRATKDRPSRRDREDTDAADDARVLVKAFKVKVTLHLSGTPYRILMGSEFAPDDIIAFCSFTDIAEAQKKWDVDNLAKSEANQKEDWENPYFGFPQMIRFAFKPNASTRARLESLKKGGATYAFSALFEPESVAKDAGCRYRRFKYEKEVLDLFQVIDGSKKDDELLGFLDYPKLKEGKMCRHIVCVLPYCASCDALAALLKRKKGVFKNLGAYEIVNVSGHDMPGEYDDVEGVKRAIRVFEKTDKKTLTLTVNRMLTGSTVPEWDTMIYFKDTASAQEYDQAIFRLQNQYVQEMSSEGSDGRASVIKYNKKPQTLLVDFDPDRLFRMQESKAKFYNVNDDEGGNAKLEERLRKEIAFSPIVRMNAGKLRQVEASDIMAAVSEYSRKRGVSDEVRDVGVDISALNRDAELLKAIIAENPLDDKNGFTISAHEGEEDGLDVPDAVEKLLENADANHDPSGKDSATTSEEDKQRKLIEAKLRSYYSRILFFAFLTKDKVQSVEDVVKVMSKGDNVRIAKNVGISKPVLKAILKFFDKFILSDLDYKIRNLDTLSFDASVDPVERATTALRKFDRLGPSEIMTPEKIADEMVALLPEDELRRIAKDGEKILDISGKAGEFAIALYKRYRAIDPKIDVRNLILTIPTSGHAYEFTRKVYEALELNVDNIAAKFTAYDLIEKDDKTDEIDYSRIKSRLTQRKPFCEITMKDKVSNRAKRNNIAVVVGNPPYQAVDGGHASSAMPVYQEFVELSQAVALSFVTLITPSRWFSGGRGLDKFRDRMLGDNRLRSIVDFLDAQECFPLIDLAGGVSYFFWDRTFRGDCSVVSVRDGKRSALTRPLLEQNATTFIRFNEAVGILHKIAAAHADSFSSIVRPNDPFGYDLRVDGTYKRIKPDVKDKEFKGSVRIHYWGPKGKSAGYVSAKTVRKGHDAVNRHKILISSSFGERGSLPYQVIGKPFIVGPGVVCTETYLALGCGMNWQQCTNVVSYMQTRFFRFLVLQKKFTQHSPPAVYQFVPMQDFNEPWTDEKLYKKYGITKEEQKFIEAMIKPME